MPDTMTRKPEQEMRGLADDLIHGAATTLVEHGVPFPMLMDRLITFCAAHVAKIHGSKGAADIFRRLADNIEAGVFHSITGEDGGAGRRH